MQAVTKKSGVQTPRSAPSSGKGPDVASAAGPVNTATGLTSEEAGRRLKQFGPNALPDTTQNPFRRALEKFWAPVPWMLEAAIVLQTKGRGPLDGDSSAKLSND